MQIDTEFSVAFLATIIVTRVALVIHPTSSPTISGFRLHHYMYGMVVAIVAVLAHNRILLAVGLGLFIDEVTFALIHGNSHKDYTSILSIVGTAILSLVTVLFSGYITLFMAT
jgi:hypothetical protein